MRESPGFLWLLVVVGDVGGWGASVVVEEEERRGLRGRIRGGRVVILAEATVSDPSLNTNKHREEEWPGGLLGARNVALTLFRLVPCTSMLPALAGLILRFNRLKQTFFLG